MKKNTYQVALPATFVAVVIAAFLSTIFLADANISTSTSYQRESSAVDNAAVERAASQEQLWNNLTQLIWKNAKYNDNLAKARSENSKSMNAVEYMKFHIELTEAHLDQLRQLFPHFEALYASMSDEEKSYTDKIFRDEIGTARVTDH